MRSTVRAWCASSAFSWRCSGWCCQSSSWQANIRRERSGRELEYLPDPLGDGTVLLHLFGEFPLDAEGFQSGHSSVRALSI